MRVAVLDHGMGNIRSVARALDRAGAVPVVTSDAVTIDGADALCVPGQGIFGRCMERIGGTLGDLIRSWIQSERPYLGICLGMQILFERSEEGAGYPGLGLLGGVVEKLHGNVTIPHIGWNTVEPGGDYYYFDHSYAARGADPSLVTGWCEHGYRFPAMIRRHDLLGVQFHPEKSGRNGILLLEKWIGSVDPARRPLSETGGTV